MQGHGPLWFSLPDCFVPMAFEQGAEERMSWFMDSLQSLAPQMTDEERLRQALIQEAVLKQMWDQGVRYGATCLLTSGEGKSVRLITGQFTVTILLAELSGVDSLSTLEKSLRLPGKKRETTLDDIPAGRALLVADETQVTLPVELYGSEEETLRTTRQIQAIIPLPDGHRMAALALATEALDDWDDFTALMREILGTVSFRPPGEKSSIEAMLGV